MVCFSSLTFLVKILKCKIQIWLLPPLTSGLVPAYSLSGRQPHVACWLSRSGTILIRYIAFRWKYKTHIYFLDLLNHLDISFQVGSLPYIRTESAKIFPAAFLKYQVNATTKKNSRMRKSQNRVTENKKSKEKIHRVLGSIFSIGLLRGR